MIFKQLFKERYWCKTLLIFICQFLVIGDCINAQSNQSSFKAGASISNITPNLDDEIVGDFNTPKTVYIHDELHVRCLILESESVTAAFGIIDNLFIRKEILDSAKAIITYRTGIPADHIMLAATHTHSSVSATGKGKKRVQWYSGESLDPYQKFLIGRIADGMAIAQKNLVPAKFASHKLLIPKHLFNRRWFVEGGKELINPFGEIEKVLMNPGNNNPHLVKPAGPIDPELSYIAFESIQGDPIALLANYSLHYVGGVPIGHVSSDYFGSFCKKLERSLDLGNGSYPFVAMMCNGSSGDINNTNVLEINPKKYKPYEKINLVAADLARQVIRSYTDLDFKDEISLEVLSENMLVGVRKPDESLLKRASNFSDIPKETYYHRAEPMYIERALEMNRSWPDSIAFDLQAFRMNNMTIVALPFEVFAETGIELKKKIPSQQTFVIGLANGALGYLPTPYQHSLGGYETWLGTNRVKENTSTEIVSKILKMLTTSRVSH